MSAQPCDPPEYTPDEDDTTALERHFLEEDPHDSTSCKRCGDVNGWGFLHLTEPEATPDTSAFRPGDLIQHRLGSLFRAQLTSQGRIVFDPLGRIGPPQDEMPDGWTLLHREQT